MAMWWTVDNWSEECEAYVWISKMSPQTLRSDRAQSTVKSGKYTLYKWMRVGLISLGGKEHLTALIIQDNAPRRDCRTPHRWTHYPIIFGVFGHCCMGHTGFKVPKAWKQKSIRSEGPKEQEVELPVNNIFIFLQWKCSAVKVYFQKVSLFLTYVSNYLHLSSF